MLIPASLPPHGNESVLTVGNTMNPTRALILLHGRGGSAEDIVSITAHLNLPDNVLVLAPQAAGSTWYPERFIAPQQANQPALDSGLARVHTLVTQLETAFQMQPEHIALAGFSQGACLTAEYLKRHPQWYLAAAIYSGGLIGGDAEVQQQIDGSLASTPIYIGCDEEDFHIPADRLRATATYFTHHEADVTLRLYTNLGHTIHPEGLEFLKRVLG
ncbi:dienelactone hydrolase family protein [Patescibacteria group bacterium]|nr:dienelactone hydrolase family protein [Patescibacteria group bacterium]